MNILLQHRYLIRHNMAFIIALCLFLYFGYHAFQGDRSLMRLHVVNKQIATLSLKNDELNAERASLEKKVTMMRPGSINKDLLEERVRATLGYSRKDEVIVFEN